MSAMGPLTDTASMAAYDAKPDDAEITAEWRLPPGAAVCLRQSRSSARRLRCQRTVLCRAGPNPIVSKNRPVVRGVHTVLEQAITIDRHSTGMYVRAQRHNIGEGAVAIDPELPGYRYYSAGHHYAGQRPQV